MEEKTQRLAIISGGGGYLGSAIRDVLRASGWRVAVLGRHLSEGDMEYLCDVTDEGEVVSTIKKITDRYGVIDACIHAAVGAVDTKEVLTLAPEVFDAQIAVTVRGAFLLAKAAVPHMREGSAFVGMTTKLINAGTSIFPMGSYIPAKYALRGFLRVLAEEVRSKGIRVYAVAPGFLPGGLNKNVPAPVMELLAAKSGVGKNDIKEVAELVKKICTEPDAYASGLSVEPGSPHGLKL